MASIQDRMIRAAKLDAELYEEVEADPTAMGQATATVVLSALAAGIGNIHGGGAMGILTATLGALVGWYVWAYLTYLIGTKLLPEPQTESNPGELLRTLGFASAPGLIRVVGIIPGLGIPAFAIAGIWMLVATVIAVRQALDYKGTGRAIAVCLIGWLVQSLILGIAIAVFAGR